MQIGNKLQQARIKSGYTQEQTADALGISRQTISNWENERTYPDIKSVVILSELYKVSLDYLLKEKEETIVNDYIDYLKESTDTVKSKVSLSKLILIISYLIIWVFSVIAFWFFTDGADAMAYGLIFLWGLLPVTTFVISLLIATNNFWKGKKWLSVLILGTMYMLSEYCTFSAANMVSFGKINLPDFTMILIGGVISSAGFGMGTLIYHIKLKKSK